MARAEDIVAETLEAEIIDGTLPPGAPLDEPSLARRFGISRTPVRAALQRLSGSGLIELRPRATRVRDPSPANLFEMFEVMAELESACARLACTRSDEHDRALLDAAVQACEAAAAQGEVSSYYAANLDFHFALYAASGNGFLAAQSRALHLRLTPFRRQQLRIPHRIGQSLGEHRAILQAIRAGTADAAGRAAFGHVAVQGERFATLIAQRRKEAPSTGGA